MMTYREFEYVQVAAAPHGSDFDDGGELEADVAFRRRDFRLVDGRHRTVPVAVGLAGNILERKTCQWVATTCVHMQFYVKKIY